MRGSTGVLVLAALTLACASDAASHSGSSESSTSGSSEDDSSSSSEGSESGSETGQGPAGPCDTEVAANGAWDWGPPLPLGPQQESAAFELDGEVVMVGGAGDIYSPFEATVQVYSPDDDSWRVGTPYPETIHHPNAAGLDGKVYILGFLREADWIPDGRALAHDLASDAWEELTPMPDGTGRGAGATAVIDGLIYVAGGVAATGQVTDFSAYDPASDAWETLPPLPTARHHFSAIVIDGILYTVGGRFTSQYTPTDEVEAYDPALGEWSSLAPLPVPRSGFSAAEFGGRLYVFGGEGNMASMSAGMFKEVHAYCPIDDSWQILPPMPFPRHGTGAATVGGLIYIPGGGDQAGPAPVDTTLVFFPELD